MRRLFALLLMLVAAPAAFAQQVVNPDADVRVASPAWPAATGPLVVVDEAHRNFHTIGGRFGPFAALLRNDGFRVAANAAPFSAETLRGVDIVVIANAAAADGAPSAFTDAEIAALRAWVEAGGALLLIADHAPFAGAATRLGAAFGIAYRNAYAVNPGSRGMDVFAPGSGLGDHIILRGAGGDAAVPSVRSFTGSAFEAPGAAPLLTLGEGFMLIEGGQGPQAIRAGDARPSAAGLLQGAALESGRGRVVVMGEAGMFTSQLAGPERRVMGFGAEGAEHNQRFALNLMHWLARRQGY